MLPKIDINQIRYNWEDTFQLTPLERAQSQAQRARAAANLAKQFNNDPLMTKVEAREIIGLSPELPSEIKEIDQASANTPQPDNTGVGANDPAANLPGDVAPAG